MKFAILAAATVGRASSFTTSPKLRNLSSRMSQQRSNAFSSTSALFANSAAQQLEGTVIVGGGIAGLATAAALRNIAGVQNVRIIEKLDKESFHNDRAGAGAQLGPNGLRALQAIGGGEVLKSIMSSGTKLSGNAILGLPHMPDGQPMVIPDTAEADTELPQILMRWGVLRSTLAGLIPDDSIAYGVGESVVGYTTNEDGTVKLVSNDGDEISSNSAPLIIGADGIYSTFRNCLAADSSTLSKDNVEEGRKQGINYNKRVNIKAVVESPMDEEKYLLGHTYSFFTPEGGTACFAGPAGEGYSYWAISVVDDTKSEEDEANASGDADGIIRLALSPEQDKADIKSALLSRLNNLEQPACEFATKLIAETDPKYIYVQLSEEEAQIGPSLVSSDGKVVCVGDSAHAMSASYGQSMNFALEDAVTLALCVRDADDNDEEGLTSALKAYEHSRLDRCEEMQRRSAERAAKAMKGEQVEDVSKWIFQWKPPM